MPVRALLLLCVWTLLVLYPNPLRLLHSTQRAWSPPLDPEAVQHLADALPDEPHLIEAAVNTTIVPYAVPWQTYGVPWYFPTTREVLATGQGDCQAQALVFASILHAKGIPAKLIGSFDHLWVDYPGKHGTGLEDEALALVEQQPNGSYAVRVPERIDWRTMWEVERAYFWDAMPYSRIGLLLSGWIIILFYALGLTRRVLFLPQKSSWYTRFPYESYRVIHWPWIRLLRFALPSAAHTIPVQHIDNDQAHSLEPARKDST